jgi:DNA polymerase-3 subunit delta
MFGGRRLIVVEDADEFVSEHRGQLEQLCERPPRRAVLVLELKSWKSNTRLARRISECGLELECSELAGARLQGWLAEFCQQRFGKQLARDAAALLVELVGEGLGSLEQEVDKLATAIGDRARITAEDVRQYVGGWKTETTWAMLNAVRDDHPAEALACLHTLVVAGEPGPKLLGGVGFVFRKLAEATELARQGRPLAAALRDAGVFPRDVDAAERYLRRIRRPRAEKILARLVQADSELKGGSPLNERLQLELLLLWLAGRAPSGPV